LSASVTEPRDKKRAAGRQAIIYICIALFCGLFAAIYEHFSHGVYSNYMIFLFAYPLFLGALPYLGISLSKRLPLPDRRGSDVWDCGVTTLTVGSCVTGVFEIYGTSSSYTTAYWPVGIALLIAGALLYVRQMKSRAGQTPAGSQASGA